VCHFPPGTSKWNKIEHPLFSHISINWRGRPLVSHEVIVELIGATRTRSVCGSKRSWTGAATRWGSGSLTGS
jgi:Rhodopirellula transposase DDE domain